MIQVIIGLATALLFSSAALFVLLIYRSVGTVESLIAFFAIIIGAMVGLVAGNSPEEQDRKNMRRREKMFNLRRKELEQMNFESRLAKPSRDIHGNFIPENER